MTGPLDSGGNTRKQTSVSAWYNYNILVRVKVVYRLTLPYKRKSQWPEPARDCSMRRTTLGGLSLLVNTPVTSM